MKKETYTIDATDRVLGRLAVQIAVLLRGKNKADFAPNKDIGNIIVVENVNRMKITGKKMSQKKYYRHSGYLGGLKETPFEKLFKENPEKILRKAVFGMLPKNKLRAEMIKRLKIK